MACHMKGAAALPMQYAMSMIAFVVIRFVWPAVTFESHARARTNVVVPTPVSHCPKSSPTLSLQGRRLTRSAPRMFGRKKIAPT